MEQPLDYDQHKTGKKKGKMKLIYFANGVRALDMRAAGMQWGEIAEALGKDNPNTVLKMARAARERIEKETAEELRAIHHQRYEDMYRNLGSQIAKGNARGIEVAVKVLESDAKLMGINADAKQEQGNFQPILIQIQPNPADREAVKLAAKNAIIDSKPKLLPSPD